MTEIFTVGHSNRSFEQLLQILRNNDIELLVDVRGGRAGSRTFPHFNTENLAVEFPKHSIAYTRLSNLGGRRGKQELNETVNAEWRLPAFKNYADYAVVSPDFDAGIESLISFAKQKRTAYMCSEAVPWRCHRSIISDYLILVHKIKVTHILNEKQTLNGAPHKHAVLNNQKVIYPKRT